MLAIPHLFEADLSPQTTKHVPLCCILAEFTNLVLNPPSGGDQVDVASLSENYKIVLRRYYDSLATQLNHNAAAAADGGEEAPTGVLDTF